MTLSHLIGCLARFTRDFDLPGRTASSGTLVTIVSETSLGQFTVQLVGTQFEITGVPRDLLTIVNEDDPFDSTESSSASFHGPPAGVDQITPADLDRVGRFVRMFEAVAQRQIAPPPEPTAADIGQLIAEFLQFAGEVRLLFLNLDDRVSSLERRLIQPGPADEVVHVDGNFAVNLTTPSVFLKGGDGTTAAGGIRETYSAEAWDGVCRRLKELIGAGLD